MEFYEHLLSNDDMPMVSLMNSEVPYKVLLKGKENKHVYMGTYIDYRM